RSLIAEHLTHKPLFTLAGVLCAILHFAEIENCTENAIKGCNPLRNRLYYVEYGIVVILLSGYPSDVLEFQLRGRLFKQLSCQLNQERSLADPTLTVYDSISIRNQQYILHDVFNLLFSSDDP